jgi:hypothetical protein
MRRAKPRIPQNFQVDKGTEFKNQLLIAYMEAHKINFYTTNNPDTKAAIAERVIRTIKSRLYRYFTYANTYRFIDILQDVTDSYNKSFHRSIGMSPVDVKPSNDASIKRRLYPATTASGKPFKFQVGDTVRLAKERGSFDKGYQPGWTEELFTISRCITRIPNVYKVKDLSGEEVEGTFYKQELQDIRKTDNVYKVESILDTRTRSGKREYLIKWLGYPQSMASWEPEDNISLL